MVILRSSAPNDLKAKNAFVVTLVKKLRLQKTNAEKRLTLAQANEDKAYYTALIADYAESINAAIESYITVY